VLSFPSLYLLISLSFRLIVHEPVEFLTSLFDENGIVNIPGFYESPIQQNEHYLVNILCMD